MREMHSAATNERWKTVSFLSNMNLLIFYVSFTLGAEHQVNTYLSIATYLAVQNLFFSLISIALFAFLFIYTRIVFFSSFITRNFFLAHFLGVDYLSVAAYDDLIPSHLVFLKSRVCNSFYLMLYHYSLNNERLLLAPLLKSCKKYVYL